MPGETTLSELNEWLFGLFERSAVDFLLLFKNPDWALGIAGFPPLLTDEKDEKLST